MALDLLISESQMQKLLPDVESNQSALAQLDPNTEGNSSRFLRSRQTIDALRQEFLFSEKRARVIRFGEIEAILCQFRSPIPVAKLTREAAARGRERAWQAGARAALLAGRVALAAGGTYCPAAYSS
jgi:hypothetical protein